VLEIQAPVNVREKKINNTIGEVPAPVKERRN
jgi:hypothetical protein